MTGVAVIQARMGSTRLPGKVMKVLRGRTVLGHVITRVRACPLLDAVVVATTTASLDDVIVAESQRCGAEIFRGSEDDVLARYYGAAREAGAAIVVRVTSDCPLFDPQVLTALLQEFHQARAVGRPLDYLSNTLERTFPRGLDAEIFTFAALAQAYREAARPYEREHVTPYIYQHPEVFTLGSYRQSEDQSHRRWTLDTEDDWRLIQAVYEALYEENRLFTTQEVMTLLAARPDLVALNAHVEQKELKG
jgi:spore coat polysaccharide biosynthesis protein SpsF